MAKKKQFSIQYALRLAKEQGVDFNKDFHAQSKGEELKAIAVLYGYKKSASASGSIGRSFFNYLVRINNKNK